ncbi:MAG: putative Fe-S cluster assembly protein SufT [Chloroflexi bacterium]|nr:putative Fe-S cluster assembly protein SufT [Chloroflexota bacterium]
MTSWDDAIVLSRDIVATEIPYGFEVPLTAGSKVVISQAMGGSFTVVTQNGQMVRIVSADADAIGQEARAEADASLAIVETDEDVEKLVWEQLRTCYDPEIPVNIADLGLIYGCSITPADDSQRRVDIQMTLTAPGCGMGEILKVEVEEKLSKIPTVKEVEVEIVFEPPWEMSMMPEAAKLQLGLM